MKLLAQLTWQLVRWPGLLALICVCGIFVAMSNGSEPSLDNLFNLSFLVAAAVGGRIMSIAGMRTWRMLPDGHRVLVRALAALTVLTALLVGGLAAGVGLRRFTDQPLANIAFAFVGLSGLSFLMFTRELRGPIKLLVIVGVLAATVLTLLAMSRLPALIAWLAAALCVSLWIIALRSREVPKFTYAQAADARDDHAHAWLLRLRAHALLARSPAGTILSGDRAVFTRLWFALVVTIGCAVINHLFLGRGAPYDNYPLFATMVACTAAGLMLGQSLGTPARARLLWLLSGASRTGIFRLAENTLIANLLVLSLVSGLVVGGLALLRGVQVTGAEALLTLAGSMLGALIPIYLGLILPTLTRAWQRIPLGTLAGLSVVLSPMLWLHQAIAGATDDADFSRVQLLVALIAACWLLRAFAISRWKSIDWALERPVPRALRAHV
jgi:hypothetical protein